MKRYLIVACAAAALVGCANNRGGMGDDSNRESGSESRTYDRSSTNNVDSSRSNSTEPNGTGNQDNSIPKN